MLTEHQAEQLAQLGLGAEDAEAWRSSGRSEDEFGDWLIDRIARWPSGTRARETYSAETVHDFARRAILATLALGPADDLLEIGCGGGLLLRDARATGARVFGLDHSADMVALALQTSPGADVLLGRAENLPFPAASFSAVAMSIVFLFFDDPLAVLRECHRVLRPDGRLAVYTTAPELRGTPAAPEPVASHGHFYSDAELAALARDAAFDDVVAVTQRGGQLLPARRGPLPR